MDNLETILNNHTNATDWDKSKAGLLDITQFFWMSWEAPMKHLLHALEAEKSEVEPVLQALIRVDLSDENEDEDEDEDEDEE
ncbi:hypothetical protein QQZ08_001975 [Neonectria magnoliae]|uniref:Uncharacterized protein n=1 Tax=Neonectria magnoliae TaxID=2732573 RepID=A0ABR1IE42_9HYPO